MAVACSWERRLPLKRNRRQCDFSHRYVKQFRLTFLPPFFYFFISFIFLFIRIQSPKKKEKKFGKKTSNFNFSHLYVSYETGKMDKEKKNSVLRFSLRFSVCSGKKKVSIAFGLCHHMKDFGVFSHFVGVKTFYCWQTNNKSCCPAVFQGWNPMCIGGIM